MNRLRFVLPPCAADALATTGSWSMDTNDVLRDYAYYYEYDGRGRCIKKKLPGAEHILYEYDTRDRMTFSQDGVQRTSGKWTFYVYDNLNRLVQQGESSGKNTSGTVMIRNYYDDYSFVGSPEFTGGYYIEGTVPADGLLTASVITTEGGNGEKVRYAYYYDEKGRLVKTVHSPLRGGTYLTTTSYTFTDKPLQEQRIYFHGESGVAPIVEYINYSYDSSDRIQKITHQRMGVSGLAAVELVSYTYDSLGRMSAQTFHNGGYNSSYAYNVRGWLTGINNNKFSQTLSYGSYYNGNISAMNWTANGSSHSYAFTYDDVNRMLNATHGTGAYTEKVTGYDKNGNITGLQRYGNGLIDNLTYTYNGNQLTKVEDATGNTAGFKNGASQANEYNYDNNGNLTKDLNKGITNISYNSLNLPQQIQYTNGFVVNYGYSADGVKQRVQHPNSGLPDVVYCGNVIYEGGAQKFLLTEEGYVDLSTSTPVYYYYLKDHQGNNRVVINSSGTVQEVNHYYPFGSTFATSNVQPYKYNGKELDTANGLNWYDYGARHYDAALGRWHVVDPLGEKYYSTSPYAYCVNNPIKLIDTDGRKIVDTKGNVIYTHKTGWATNAPDDAIRLGNAMMLTQRGMTQFNNMVDAEHNITLSISPETKLEETANGTKYYYGQSIKNVDSEYKLESINVIVYEGTLNTIIEGGQTTKAKLYRSAVSNVDEAIGAVGTHESVHATSKKNMLQSIKNEIEKTNYDVEEMPLKAEYEYLFELIRRKYDVYKKHRDIINIPDVKM